MTRGLSLLAVAVAILAADSTAHGQFTYVINVPPDDAPTSIGSDTQLNLSGGGVLPDGFQAGSYYYPATSHVEVNISGGSVGNNFESAIWNHRQYFRRIDRR